MDRYVWTTILRCERDRVLLHERFRISWIQPDNRASCFDGYWNLELGVCSSCFLYNCTHSKIAVLSQMLMRQCQDTYGRRPLLAITYPFLCLTMLWTSLSFLATNLTVRTAMVTTGMYLFEVFYSPGMGPVPFSYAAEAFPIQVRDVGMAFGAATTWVGCFHHRRTHGGLDTLTR